MSGIRIRAMGHALPGRVVTNREFEQTLDTSDEWISERTGIRSRHFCDPDKGEDAASLAAEAAREALEKAEQRYGISRDEIQLIIAASCSSRRQMPSNASCVQEALGLCDGIPAFDINVACSGFVYGLSIADSMMRTMQLRYALVIGTEELSSILDFTDRSTCVLFGDGAAAAVISMDEQARFFSHLGASGDRQALSSVGTLRMDGHRVFRFAVRKLEEEIRYLSEHLRLPLEEVDYFVCHQANQRIIGHVRERLQQPEAKFPMNLMTLGNTSAASIPLMLYDLEQDGALKPGTRIFCVGFGAGLTWGAAYLEF